MIVHQVYALISDEIVQNICVCDDYEMANFIARASYGDNAFAVDCLQYRCMIGDTYKGGIFYRTDAKTGEVFEIEYVPTQEQQIAMLEAALADTQLALIHVYEGGV